MTSGTFTSFPIDKIWLDRTKRQRRDLPDIEGLAASISRTGLINPPVITPEGELIAGERRLTACRQLGWTSIPVQFTTDLSDSELQAVEFEENIRRVDLPWQDRCLAVERYHNLRLSLDPEWNATRTAEALGISVQEISDHRAVAKELEKKNEHVLAVDKFSTARNIVRRDTERKRTSGLAAAVTALIPSAGEEPAVENPKRRAPLLNIDFNDWLASSPEVKYNFLHCDFPYGVGMHKSDQGSGQEFGTYADDKDVYWKLLESFRGAMDSIVAESAHLMFWFSMDYYTETKQLLEAMGWRINPFPLIWFKSDNTGIIPDAQRGPRRVYETAFFGSRGDRMLTPSGAVSNVFAYAGRGKTIHMNEKPVPMLKHFMSMFVDEYSLVLDPTCGSGNALKAAEELGANHVLGLERSEEFFTRASEAYYGGTEERSGQGLSL